MAEVVPRVIPLMCGFIDLIEGRGFVAKIRTNGRAVAEIDDDACWWINGVTPGGVCASGATAQEALKSFRLAYHEVLLDCALRCRTFDSFRSEVELIFDSTTPDIVGEWQDAVVALRDGASAGPLEGLARKPADSRAYGVAVERIVIADAEPQHAGDPDFAQAA